MSNIERGANAIGDDTTAKRRADEAVKNATPHRKSCAGPPGESRESWFCRVMPPLRIAVRGPGPCHPIGVRLTSVAVDADP